MGLARYAVRYLVRTRRRMVPSILGVLLAVSFVSATFIAIDSSVRGQFDSILLTIPGDFRASGVTTYWQEFAAHVEAVYRVVDVIPSVLIVVPNLVGETGARLFGQPVEGIVTTELPAIARYAQVRGDLALPRGTVALSEGLARNLGVDAGDTVGVPTCQPRYFYYVCEGQQGRLDLTVGAVLFRRPGFHVTDPLAEGRFLYVNIGDAEWLWEQVGGYTQFYDLPYRPTVLADVWIDHVATVDVYDLETTERNLVRIRGALEQAVRPYDGGVVENLLPALGPLRETLSLQRLVIVFVALPILGLGLYLGIVGIELGHADRRREFAILKARGATGRQTFRLIMLEAILGGVVAAIFGLVLGVLLSWAFVPFLASPDVEVPLATIVIARDVIFGSLIVSVLLMLAASYRSARRTARLPPAEALRHYAPGEASLVYRPLLDLILGGLAMGAMLGVLYSQSTRGPTSLLVESVAYLLLPFVPFFLVVAVTRLATRASGRPYAWATRAWRPFARNLHLIVERNLSRNLRRSSNVAVLIAFGLAFGVFTLSLLASMDAWQDRQVRAVVGADLVAEAENPSTFLQGRLDEIRASPGVAAATVMIRFQFDSTIGFVSVYAVDPDSYFTATQPEDWYFPDGLASARGSLDAGRLLISQPLAADAAIIPGDVITLRFDGYYRLRFDVVLDRIVLAMPGTMPDAFSLPRALYASYATVERFLGQPADAAPPGYASSILLIDLNPGADVDEVMSVVGGAVRVLIYEEELAASRTGTARRAFLGFLRLEATYAALFVTVGLGLIVYAAARERDVEFAAIIARGASGPQTARLLVGEAFAVLLVGLVAGVGVGVLAGWAAGRTIIAGPPGTPVPVVPIPFVVPVEALLVVGLAAFASILASYILALRIARMDLARVLKVRGG